MSKTQSNVDLTFFFFLLMMAAHCHSNSTVRLAGPYLGMILGKLRNLYMMSMVF